MCCSNYTFNLRH